MEIISSDFDEKSFKIRLNVWFISQDIIPQKNNLKEHYSITVCIEVHQELLKIFFSLLEIIFRVGIKFGAILLKLVIWLKNVWNFCRII